MTIRASRRRITDGYSAIRLRIGRLRGPQFKSRRLVVGAPPEVVSWSVPSSPYPPEVPMRHVTACLTIVALAVAFPARAEVALPKSLAITGVTVIDATGAPA